MKEEDKGSLGIKKANLLGTARSQESGTKGRGPSATPGGEQTEGQQSWRIKMAPGHDWIEGDEAIVGKKS